MAYYDFATRMQNEQGAFYNMPTYEGVHLGHSNKRMELNLKEASYEYHKRPSVAFQKRRKAGFKSWRTRRERMHNLSPYKGNGDGLKDFRYVDPFSTTMYIPQGFYDDY
tara:strand:+ start:848 stop:1174 length:327 start_codon:yes stop_codon:yes gene_type:complete